MRPTRAVSLLGLFLLASCATNPLQIPPRPHALPSRPRFAASTEGHDVVAESRPAAVPIGFAAGAPGEAWRKGDAVAFEFDFEDGGTRRTYWLLLEVVRGPRDEGDLARASVKTTLLDADGVEIGTAVKRIAPSRIEEAGSDVVQAYTNLVARALGGESVETIQDTIDEDLGEGSTFDDARRRAYRELRRTVAPRFVREALKEPAIASSIGSISVFDLALAALTPVEVLVDVNRLAEDQAGLADLADVPALDKIRVPLVMSIGGAIQFRFAITMAPPAPPFSLAGGILEIAGVNEARGDRSFLVRLVSATRGEAPESRPVESRAASRPEVEDKDDDDR